MRVPLPSNQALSRFPRTLNAAVPPFSTPSFKQPVLPDRIQFSGTASQPNTGLFCRLGNGCTALWNSTITGLRYVTKRTLASASYLFSQAKMLTFLGMGVVAFFPLPKRMRNWVERMAVFPPMKMYDYPFKKTDELKNAYTQIKFNMGGILQSAKPSVKKLLQLDAKADDIKLRAWHVAPKNPEMPTVVFHQERSSNMSYHGPLMTYLRNKGYGVFLYDYPGYGSEGKAGEAAMYKAGFAVSQKLAALGVPVAKQVHMGYSLGTPVAARVGHVLQENGEKPKALVLINSFPSLKEMVKFNVKNNTPLFPRCLIGEKAIQRIQTELDCTSHLKPLKSLPILFLQGAKDRSAPKELVEEMAKKMHHTPDGMKTIEEIPNAYHKLKEEHFKVAIEHFDAFMEKQQLKQPNQASPAA